MITRESLVFYIFIMQFGKVIQTCTSKKGNTVTFRYLREDDLDNMLSYINALIAEDTFIGMYGAPLSREEEKKHLDETIDGMKKGEKIVIVAEINGIYAGSGDLRRETVRRKKHGANIGISLLAKYREEGIGTLLLKALIDEARIMGLRLLTLTCFENNDRALHVYEKLGFKQVGLVPEACLYKDNYYGEVVMFMKL